MESGFVGLSTLAMNPYVRRQNGPVTHSDSDNRDEGKHGAQTSGHQSSNERHGLQAIVITVSDGVIAATREDLSGEALAACLETHGWNVVERRQIVDGVDSVHQELVRCAEGFNGLIVTTGGTGFGPRDLTPEGTRLALEREAPGLAEAMRLCNPKGLGRLSRALAGTRGAALILNTPGSTKGTVETVEAVIDIVPHAIELMAGGRPH